MITLRWLFLVLLAHTATAAPVRVLLLSGQNNHDWKKTTPVLQAALEECGRFSGEGAMPGICARRWPRLLRLGTESIRPRV